MTVNDIIIYIMVIFAVLGALDRMLGNRFGLEEKFEEGIKAIGVLAISMVGMISLAPVLAKLLQPVMTPVKEGFAVVADIAIVLAGALPLMHVLTKILKKPLMKIGKLLGINETAAAGMVASLANSVSMFGMIKDMDDRGKVINMAFATSAAFVFGDHLGFTAGFNQDMIVPMIVGKLVGGVSAVAVALFLLKKRRKKYK